MRDLPGTRHQTRRTQSVLLPLARWLTGRKTQVIYLLTCCTAITVAHLALGSRDRDRPSTSFSPRTLQTIIHIAVGSTEEQAATVLRFVPSTSFLLVLFKL